MIAARPRFRSKDLPVADPTAARPPTLLPGEDPRPPRWPESTLAQPPGDAVTFLFTDIEGSTRRWDRDPEAMAAALARHDALLAAVIAGHGGNVFKTVGDAFCAAFASAPD